MRVYREVLCHVHAYEHNATTGRVQTFTVADDAMASDPHSTDSELENACLDGERCVTTLYTAVSKSCHRLF